MDLLRIYFTNYLMEQQQLMKSQKGVWGERRRSVVLQTPRQLISSDDPFSSIHKDVLLVCLGDQEIVLETVQNRMNDCNLTKLVVNTIKSSPCHPVMIAAVELAVALLNNGNRYVQVCYEHNKLVLSLTEINVECTQSY